MATDEEYLDNLLKSMMEKEEPKPLTENDEKAEEMPEEVTEEVVQEATDEVAEETPEEVTEEIGEDISEDWKADLDDILAQVGEAIQDETVDENNQEEAAPIDNTEHVDDDLSTLNALFGQEEEKSAVDEDMLALLESMGNESKEASDSDNISDPFSDDMAIDLDNISELEEKIPEKKHSGKKKREKKPKKKRSLFGKKNMEQAEEEGLETLETAEIPEVEEEENKKDVKEKKPGFFSKLIQLLTEEEETEELVEPENSENAEETGESETANKELSKKEEKKKKKEEKRKKKEEKKKGKKEKAADGEGDNPDAGGEETAEEEDPKKKAKREKKEKKKQEKELQKLEKPVKVLSRRSMLVMIAACATIIAGILALSTFLPDYADKKAAREAFYVGDYETVYELLYDKRLNASDQLIFNRVQTVLRLERKVNSYNNNIALNREVEAIDALLRGITCYQDLAEADEYGVRDEVDVIYQEICSILKNNYNITLEEAIEINSYDKETYTRRLYSIVNGTEFVKPGEEAKEQEPLPPQDILADEEEIIRYE